MALIPFERLLEHLQSSLEIPNGILTDQKGLYYSDIHFMPLQCMLKMQCIPFTCFCNLVDDNAFHPPNYKLKDASGTTALLLEFITSNDLTAIKCVHVGLIIHHAARQVYEPKLIPAYIKYIREDSKHIKQRLEA